MARINQGILGAFSGKVANVVGSSWKGIAVMKSLPASVANPRSVAQVAQREKFAAIVAVARLLLASIIQPFWNPFAQRQSGYNAFVSTNIDTFVGDVFTAFSSFFSQRGSLLGVVVGTVVADNSDNTIVIPWTDNTGQSDALATDEINVTYYNATQEYWRTDVGNATRDDATRTITDTTMGTGDVLHIYVGTARPNRSKVSDSVYATATVVA